MPFIAMADVRLYYERAGAGFPLLTISGTGSDLRQHPNVLDWPLTSTFDVVAYDHRGLGRSDPAEWAEQPTMADFGADALALADHLGWTRFRVLGISFGGMVAQELALMAGPRIERLALVCTSAGGLGGSSFPLHEIYKLDETEQVERQLEIMDTRTSTDPKLKDQLRSWVAGREVAPGLARQLEARRRHDTWDRLDQLAVPTFVAAGRYDGIAPKANSEAMAARIPGATLEVFDGGHGFVAQDPTALPAIVKFLAG